MLPGATAPVLVGIVVVDAVPLSKVVPAGAPPPPPEFASAALFSVTWVSLSIDTILVPVGYDLPELTNKPTARFLVLLTVIVFWPWTYAMFTSTKSQFLIASFANLVAYSNISLDSVL